jgi:hypothetical protein
MVLTLQARGEFTNVNEEDKPIHAKVVIPNFNVTPNLGDMLHLNLDRQAHQTRGDITCGGIAAILATTFGLDLCNLQPLGSDTCFSFRSIDKLNVLCS